MIIFKEFVEAYGYHTNNTEGVHSTTTWVKQQHHVFGMTSMDLKRNVALQCIKFGSFHNQRRKAWRIRLIELLNCIKDHYGYEANDQLEDVSESYWSKAPPDSEDILINKESSGDVEEDGFLEE